MPNSCFMGSVLAPPDLNAQTNCIESGAETISQIWVRNSGKPMVLLPAQPNEAEQARIERSITAELAKTGEDKIHVLHVYKGQMPAVEANLKMNPLDGSKHMGDAVDATFEWTDYRDNQDLDIWYSKMTGSEHYATDGTLIPSGQPVGCIAWAKAGDNLIGGMDGYNGTFSVTQKIVDGSEVAFSKDGKFHFKRRGGNPKRVKFRLA